MCIYVCVLCVYFSHLFKTMYIQYTLSHKEHPRSLYSTIARNMFVLYLHTRNILYYT